MNFFSDGSRVINALLILGVLFLLFAVVLTGQAVWKYADRLAPPSIELGAMGQEGVACGGPERLPCVPGFVCDTDDDAVYGTCVEDVRETFPLGEKGTVCGQGRGCVPGLVCNAIGGAAGVCIDPTETP